MQDLTDRTVMITGAARGIGRGMARAFVRAGARVAITDIDIDQARTTRDELTAGGAEAIAIELDVRDRASFQRAVDEVEEHFGPVEVLCNNAGIGTAVPLADLGFDDWDRVLGINVGGVINGIQTVLPRMLSRGGPGHIINTASGAGLVATTNLTYSTSKFAVVGMSESLRQQQSLLQAGIGVSVLCPGPVRTDVLQDLPEQAESLDQHKLELGRRFLQEHGVDPDVVGEQVVAAVREDRLHVQTDRSMEGLLAERAGLLIESLPPATEHDERLAPMLRQLASSLTPPLQR